MATAINRLGSSFYVVNDLTIGLQSGSSNTLYATWTWRYGNTDHFEVTWRYYTGDGVWFIGSESNVTGSSGWTVRATYSIPSNAYRVACTVKPVSKTYEKKKGKTTYQASYWTASTTTEYYTVSDQPYPATPGTPTVSIDTNYYLKATLNVSDEHTDYIEYQVIQDNTKTFKHGLASITTGVAGYKWKISAGHSYKVRARARMNLQYASRLYPSISAASNAKDYIVSEWGEYSSNVATVPSTPERITSHEIETTTSLYLNWNAVATATSYTVEYSVSNKYFDVSSSIQNQTVNTNRAHLQGLESGRTWYFRVKATNSQGDSGWSPVYAVGLGIAPSAPTTWSETSTAIAGDIVRLYWIHNAEDGSTQSAAVVQVSLNGGEWTDLPSSDIHASTETGQPSYAEYRTYLSTTANVLDDDSYNITDSSNGTVTSEVYTAFAEGAFIRWRVKTKGVVDEYSPWSTERLVTVYGPPVINLIVTDSEDSDTAVETFDSLPIYVKATASPASQTAIGWVLSVVSNSTYEAYDEIGQRYTINVGDELYSEYISGGSNTLLKTLSAEDVNLVNEISYTIKLSVSMNSGLETEDSQSITIDWSDFNLWPNAEIGIDTELLCAYVKPYCLDDNEGLIDNVTLSVYRRDYNGSFTLIASGIENDRTTVVTDPHPALDYARYRIIAVSTETGQIGFYDPPAELVGETGIVLQWDETWTDFNIPSGDGDGLADPVYSGSMLKLPYNIKIAESSSIDTSLVEYIGRSAPVSYYGTQLGLSGSWSSEIPATDDDTRYALRRLQVWRGDVYVRAPNGVGYWANVNVSFNKDYNSLLTPVTIDVTRVEGGI